MGFKPSRASGIVRSTLGIPVDPAVDFQYSFELRAVEVDDETTDRVLTPKLQVKQAAISE